MEDEKDMDAEAQAYEEGMARYAASIYGDCRCCERCSERPCGGCMQGGVCDDMECRCDQGFDDDDELEDEDWDW